MARGGGEKMSAVFKRKILTVADFQPRFMNQRSRLESFAPAAAVPF